MRIDVLGVGFDNLTMQEAVAAGLRLAGSPGCHYVVTPNPEIVEVCRENLAAKIAVNEADLVLPDGIGVVKGAAMLGTPLKERVPGYVPTKNGYDGLVEDVLANWEYIWDEAIVYNVMSTIVYTNEPKKDFDWYDGLKLLHLIDFAAWQQWCDA